MKTLLILACCLASFATFADDSYTPPTELTPADIDKVVTSYITNTNTRENRIKARLALAKQNNQKLAKSGTPVARPYYGDSAHVH
ncbi:MAG: hypothetical protein NTV00_00045 [Methylococcales bacterium]|nr:hypothetical protein [Methylococcales bacterium]